jgi:hypothetical protein
LSWVQTSSAADIFATCSISANGLQVNQTGSVTV